MIALTATATKSTRETIFAVLLMDKPCVIFESPNKDNIAYVVEYMSRDEDLEHYFSWLVEELREKKEHCDRTIIYCQTIKQCGLLYATLKAVLGNDMRIGNGCTNNCIIEMLHSRTPLANKESIIKSFSEEWGVIRVLIATIAFGMGVNCQAVSRVIHFGPAKNIESYAQETGRAGRNGSQAVAYLLYNGILLNHVEWDMKSYVRNDMCRRTTILKHFDEDASPHLVLHLCCDYCASHCKCGSFDCGTLTTYPSKVLRKEPESKLRSRGITNEQMEAVHEKLTTYHKMLISNLVSTSAKTELKTLTGISLVLGFSELQIQHVLENLHNLFSLLDICKFVEIWDMTHAHKILSIIKEIFKDVQDNTCNVANAEYEIDDTGLLEDWETIIEDDELFAMAVENLSVSQLDESFTEQSANLSGASLDMSLLADVLDNI
jgi:ATP-dependent DNA helicase RecQ